MKYKQRTWHRKQIYSFSSSLPLTIHTAIFEAHYMGNKANKKYTQNVFFTETLKKDYKLTNPTLTKWNLRTNYYSNT